MSDAFEQARMQAASIAQMVAALSVDYDRLQEIREQKQEWDIENPGRFLEPSSGQSNWGLCFPDENDEVAELEENAGYCKSEDDARERIQEDPLSVEVRSGWESSKEEFKAEEFQILLCTGGPAVRIMGELDEDAEPIRAWIEYQDWGTGWCHACGVIDQATLLTYCRQFSFGE